MNIVSSFGYSGLLNLDKSLDAIGEAAQGTLTKAGIPYKTDSTAAILLKATVAKTPESNTL